MRCQHCRMCPGFPCTGVVFAYVTYAPSGNVLSICERELNSVLDLADDEPDLEPAGISFVVPRGTRSYNELALRLIKNANA